LGNHLEFIIYIYTVFVQPIHLYMATAW